jgi:MFS family permease
MPLIYVTLGFLTGLGNGLAYTACLLAVNDYFSRRRATALGLATCGAGLGGFCLPLLTQFLIERFAFRGCMLILAGLCFNMVACGAAFYPLEETKAAGGDGETEALKEETVEDTVEEAVDVKDDGRGSRLLRDLLERFDLRLMTDPVFFVFCIRAMF